LETRSYNLNKGEVLLVRGPAAVRAESKGSSVLGIRIEAGDKIVVKKNRVLPFEADESGSLIQVILGDIGESWITRDRVGMRIWNILGESIFTSLKPGKNKLMIIGETDSGKSTLTSYLANKALMRGLRAAIIDGDIGQGDLVPPGCTGASVVRNRIYDLRDLRADILGFVGFTSPSFLSVRDLIIKRMKELISYLEEREYDLCIINTDGYVADGGMDYKVDMIRELKPDIIICFKEIDKELLERLKDFENPPVVVPADRPEGIVKSISQRSERRLSQYFRFLKDGKDLSIDLKKLRLSFMGNLYDHNLSDLELKDQGFSLPEAGFAKRADNKIIVFRSNMEDLVEVFDRSIIFNQGSLSGMFAGLGSGDYVAGFARIARLHPNQIITLNTNFKGKFDTLFLSTIRISQDLKTEAILPVVRIG